MPVGIGCIKRASQCRHTCMITSGQELAYFSTRDVIRSFVTPFALFQSETIGLGLLRRSGEKQWYFTHQHIKHWEGSVRRACAQQISNF